MKIFFYLRRQRLCVRRTERGGGIVSRFLTRALHHLDPPLTEPEYNRNSVPVRRTAGLPVVVKRNTLPRRKRIAASAAGNFIVGAPAAESNSNIRRNRPQYIPVENREKDGTQSFRWISISSKRTSRGRKLPIHSEGRRCCPAAQRIAVLFFSTVPSAGAGRSGRSPAGSTSRSGTGRKDRAFDLRHAPDGRGRCGDTSRRARMRRPEFPGYPFASPLHNRAPFRRKTRPFSWYAAGKPDDRRRGVLRCAAAAEGLYWGKGTSKISCKGSAIT